jgi:formate-dependent nitrite reductase membrane component NrfD
MHLDLRLPIGLLFSLLGLLLTIAGLAMPRELYQKAMGLNVNLLWGLVVLAFGAVMLALALQARKGRGGGGL